MVVISALLHRPGCCADVDLLSAGCCSGMGGAYLTLLNTIANMGVIMPKTPLFAAMDWLTFSQCHDNKGILMKSLTCPKKIRLLTGGSPCTDAGTAALQPHLTFQDW